MIRKPTLVAAALAAALAIAPVASASADPAGATPVQLAQYWSGYKPYYPPPPPPPPPPPQFGWGPPPGPSYGYRPRPPRGLGTVCYTTRGTCALGYAAPRGAPCQCVIPWFGVKRGNVI